MTENKLSQFGNTVGDERTYTTNIYTCPLYNMNEIIIPWHFKNSAKILHFRFLLQLEFPYFFNT